MRQTNIIIDQSWPEGELETLTACPYCGSADCTLAYKEAQDWSFYSAPGKWSYWDCSGCGALYLSPRPKEAYIGKAYASYYTHDTSFGDISQKLRTQLKNEYLSHLFGIDIRPRFNLPKCLSFLLKPFQHLINVPFGLRQLADLPKGKLLDVGCGSGASLKAAQQLGWDVIGLEVDPAAVQAARSIGLNIIEGDYKQLSQFTDCFDCIVCSHVLEHVYSPLKMIGLLKKALRPGGVLLLSLPNANSHVREVFGENWRGLEAPRHVAIPSLAWLQAFLSEQGFFEYQVAHKGDWTTGASREIMESRGFENLGHPKYASETISPARSDFIQFVCIKRF